MWEGEGLKAIQKWLLAGQYLFSGERKIQPGRAIDFRNIDGVTTSWRPFDRDRVTVHLTRIKITFQRKGTNYFPGALTYVAKWTERADRFAAEFFSEFAPRCGLCILSVVQFTFWN